MTRRRAVLFDLYGTLVDLHIDEKTASVWDGIAAEVFKGGQPVAGTTLRESYYELCEAQSREKEQGFLLDSVFSQLLSRFGVPSERSNVKSFASIFRRHSIVYLEKRPYTDALLRDLRGSGYKLGLISNTEELVTLYDLDVLRLEPAFDEIILSSEFGVRKPHRAIFAEMLTRLGVDPESAAYVGNDFDEDVLGALHTGMDAVYLTSEAEPVLEVIEDRYAGRVRCAMPLLDDIRLALQKLCFVLE